MTNWTLTRTFAHPAGDVRYDVWGAGPPLVLVHGTPWSSFNWRHVIPALAEWFTVYAYDLVGYGQSEQRAGQDVSLAVQNAVLADLLDHWSLDAPRIVGHDFGGTTVLRTHLLGERPFSRIALIDPVALAPWGSAFFRHVNQHAAVFEGIPPAIHEAIVAAYVDGATHRPMDAATLAGICAPWVSETGQAAFYRQIAQADQRYTDEIEPLYGSITTPTLILWGEQDQWIPLEKGRQLHAAIPSSAFTPIPAAGHLVQEDRPALIVSLLLKFFGADRG